MAFTSLIFFPNKKDQLTNGFLSDVSELDQLLFLPLNTEAHKLYLDITTLIRTRRYDNLLFHL
jgi:hypothetical protein